ncbi:ribonuclease E activity regulator RraA [Agaribacter marinus]|uniref:Regulator of ribonuclease activity A n=1 Tax=Agaribacter marinus TaxID=1431249 RepID=A0AA37WHZ7_9ALTE|nr:ribonuclease E activity regulator RraA [Agaribacter marinus]GLR69199.1 regulator of ribonuclease activity A [Agaribacter marinus]
MEYNTSELCDLYSDSIDVVDPIFVSYGGRYSYAGEVTTIKCFEDRGLVDKVLASDGQGKVLLIDGGGSLRRALLDADNIQLAIDNDWEGIICFGAVREVDLLEELDIGIHALNAIPVAADAREIGDLDVAVNFAGVTFLPEDFVYADGTGIILSPEPLEVTE